MRSNEFEHANIINSAVILRKFSVVFYNYSVRKYGFLIKGRQPSQGASQPLTNYSYVERIGVYYSQPGFWTRFGFLSITEVG